MNCVDFITHEQNKWPNLGILSYLIVIHVHSRHDWTCSVHKLEHSLGPSYHHYLVGIPLVRVVYHHGHPKVRVR